MPHVSHNSWKRLWLSTPIALLAVNCAMLPSCSKEHSGMQKSSHAKASLPDYLRQLLTADSFQDSVRGESPNLPKNYATYLDAAKIIPNLVPENLRYVRDHALPAGRLYAAILLKQSDQPDSESFGKLLNDKAPVDYFSGCKGMSTTVSEIAHSFLEKGRFQNFALANYCTAPLPLIEPGTNNPSR